MELTCVRFRGLVAAVLVFALLAAGGGAAEAGCDLSASATSFLGGQFDLEISKRITSGGSFPEVGDIVVFEITVEEVGGGDGSCVSLFDTLPPDFSYIDHEVTDSNGTTTVSCNGADDFGCGVVGVSNGGSFTIELRVQVEASGKIENTASVSSLTVDADESNNSETVSLAVCTIKGTNGPDNLFGTNGDDVICGMGGADQISGGPGDDCIFGGSGADDILGGPGDDEIRGQGGRDNIHGEGGADRLFGGGGRDDLNGGDGADLIRGGGGGDLLIGGDGGDTLFGGGGNDVLLGGPGADTLVGGSGNSDNCSAGGDGGDTEVGCEE